MALEAPPSSSRGIWIAIASVAVLAGAAIAFWLRSPSEPASAPAAKPAAVEPAKPAEAPLANIPPLDESDSVVADLVKKLSSHALVTSWLTTNGLIRHFAVVVANVADGQAPTALLRTIRPTGPFRVIDRKEVFIDTRSYARYTPLADAVASLDPQACARLYATLKPRLEEAHREAGERNTSFDQTLERAIVMILKTPVPSGPVALEPHGIVYIYADPKIEAMPPAQRQLIRMGPENARTIQTKLRAIALAIGIPSERLPEVPLQ